jgi:hypothetical protein
LHRLAAGNRILPLDLEPPHGIVREEDGPIHQHALSLIDLAADDVCRTVTGDEAVLGIVRVDRVAGGVGGEQPERVTRRRARSKSDT